MLKEITHLYIFNSKHHYNYCIHYFRPEQVSKTSCLILQGKKSFSISKLDQLNRAFNKANGLEALISCNEIYLISSQIALDTELEEISKIVKGSQNIDTFLFLIGPRSGTITPWSSKTEDIFKNVGIKQIERVERFFGFSITGLNQSIDALDLSMLFDRMTQDIYKSVEDCSSILNPNPKRLINHIDILTDGKGALVNANKAFGFALSADEIDYLFNFYSKEDRNPTDAELMMFAQANSEHCRHKIFNADWIVDEVKVKNSLFDLIKVTSKNSPNGIISAYKDNAAVTKGKEVKRLHQDEKNLYSFKSELLNSTIKVETHNHPTAISPYPGAATGSGGEIRDEGATGRGAKPKIGLVGYNVSNLRIPNLSRDWENDEHSPERIASPLDIMIEAPIGAAAFNNEFGRPCTLGYFRSFETPFSDEKVAFGYHKPIMLAGGIGEIRDKNNFKLQIEDGYIVVVLGGPAMLIGLGGGAASSVSSGDSDEDLDFASVQRDNAEMERRCQEVINRCSSMDESYIEFIHDVGAGGLSNAIPELAKDSELGVLINLDSIPSSDESMSPMEIWSNESQERYVLAIHPDNKEAFVAICERERCAYALVGYTTEEKFVKLYDFSTDTYPVDVPLSMLFGELPISNMEVKSESYPTHTSDMQGYALEESIHQVLQHPTVACKSFLITIGDRTVGGMTARDQFIGPWQVPTSNFSMSLRSFTDFSGEVVTIGEKPTLAINNPAASMRMAMAEALTNMVSAPIVGMDQIQVSANWMAASGENIEDLALRKGVEALSNFSTDLGISIPVGKDSLSMRTKWQENNDQYVVKSPLSGVITAMAPVDDVRDAVTTLLKTDIDSQLVLIKLNDKNRLGGSIFSEVYKQDVQETPDVDSAELFIKMFDLTQSLIQEGSIDALHDVSDGGLVSALCELAFTARTGISINLDSLVKDKSLLNEVLFNEEIGLILQINKSKVSDITNQFNAKGLNANVIGELNNKDALEIKLNDKTIFSDSVANLETIWRQTSHAIQSLRDNKESADSELSLVTDGYTGLFSKDSFIDPDLNNFSIKSSKPSVAILREQGVNGQMEMAAAFHLAGFNAVDVHMQDLLDGSKNINNFNGMAVCGGFSYGDVLGAGGGWSKTILHNQRIKDQFEEFFVNNSTFTLGVCNGCQMLSNLKDIIPDADNWPDFVKNRSDQFEARLVQVEINKSNSVLLQSMEGWQVPIASAHGEGRALFVNEEQIALLNASSQVAVKYINSQGQPTEQYPLNPNGSTDGLTGITAADGRVTIMMPHPERVFRAQQFSWKPSNWKDFSPWMQMFLNARLFSEGS